jgi:hypothetical protein
MTADAAAFDPAGAVAKPVDAWARDRRFFTGMALAIMLTVFIGFAPSFYLKAVFGAPGVSGAPILSPLMHVHGFVFTTWIVLFLVQTRLVAGRRLALHRRLGYGAAALAVAMVVLGTMAAVDAARRGAAPPGGPPPLVFMIVPIADMAIFSTLVGAGVWFRNRADIHKRLMLVSTIAILTAAIARWPGVLAGGPLVFFALTDLFVVVGMVYDRRTRGRVHPAYWWGGGLLLASQVGRLVLSGTSAWLSFATWLAG